MQSKAQRSFDDEVLDFKWLFNHEQHSSFPMETIFSFFTILEISRDLSCVEMRSKADKTPVTRDDTSWALKPGHQTFVAPNFKDNRSMWTGAKC